VARAYWLIKSEPFKYAWSELVADGKTYWDGVRNYEARNNLASMKLGDLALYYHSNEGKEVVGIAEIVGEAYPDPTAEDPRWVVVDVAPVVPFTQPVSLATIKSDPALADMALIRRSRLSVVPVTADEFRYVAKLGRTKVPPARAGASRKNPAARKSAARR
jgi:predicted RNA-binding protein with PUA-like domain